MQSPGSTLARRGALRPVRPYAVTRARARCKPCGSTETLRSGSTSKLVSASPAMIVRAANAWCGYGSLSRELAGPSLSSTRAQIPPLLARRQRGHPPALILPAGDHSQWREADGEVHLTWFLSSLGLEPGTGDLELWLCDHGPSVRSRCGMILDGVKEDRLQLLRSEDRIGRWRRTGHVQTAHSNRLDLDSLAWWWCPRLASLLLRSLQLIQLAHTKGARSTIHPNP
jgi:hypothetical protein